MLIFKTGYMKKIVLLSLLLISCNSEVEKLPNVFYVIDPLVHKYVMEYVKDVESVGLSVENENKSFSVILGRLPRNVAGMAIGMFNPYAVNVILDINIWKLLSESEKKALVYHELSHDVFGLHHNTCDIMTGSLRGITDEMIKELLDTLIKQQNK